MRPVVFKYGKKKPQGATRNLPKSATPAVVQPRAKGLLPGWLLVGFGVTVGLFFAFVLYLWQPWKPVKKAAPAVVAETPDTPVKEAGEPRFDFYTLLPSQKVTTPESATATTPPPATPPAVTKTDSSKPVSPISGPDDLAARKAEKTGKTVTGDESKTARDTSKAKDKESQKTDSQKARDKAAQDKLDKAKADKVKADKALKDKQKAEDDKAKALAALAAAEKAKTAASKDTVRYTLQAGSFKSNAEADRRRAAIMMSGLPVRVQKVTVKPGQDWYRVVVGPFTGKDKAVDARQNLQADGVDSLMVKVDKK
jgi:cell division protein FtsN